MTESLHEVHTLPEPNSRPPRPAGLGRRGRTFWRQVVDAYVLDDREVQILIEVCRGLDVIEALQLVVRRDSETVMVKGVMRVHPALRELREQRIVVGRMLDMLHLPSGVGEPTSVPTIRSLRAQRAAAVRWQHHHRRRG